VCNTTTGQYDVTYTLTTSNVPRNAREGSTMWRVGTTAFEHTPGSTAGMDRGPISSHGDQTVTLGTISVDGSATQAPWAYAYTTWSDQYAKGSDGGDIALNGDCVKLIPPTHFTPTVGFSFTPECGTLTLTADVKGNNPSWYYGIKASVDGAMLGSAVVKGDGTVAKKLTFDEDSHNGSVNVIVETYASTEQNFLPDGWALGTPHNVTITTDCQPPAPQEPTVTVERSDWTGGQPTCDDREVTQTRTATTTTVSYTPTWQDGEWVQVAGDPVVSTVDESQKLTYQGDDCEAVVPPVVTPPTEKPTEKPTVKPTVKPVVKASPKPSTTTHAVVAKDDGDLAETGGGAVSPLVPIGAAFAIALGALGVVLGMRKRQV
jgi:hypothetical protein